MISVIGGEEAPPKAMTLARTVGRELARNDITVVCGGGSGVMEEVCRGAREDGGHTIGVMPGHDAQESLPNQWVEFPVYTGLGFARNSVVVLSGQAVIAIDGSFGTLNEIAFALMHEIPIVGLGTWDFSYSRYDDSQITRVADPVEAVRQALELAKKRSESVIG